MVPRNVGWNDRTSRNLDRSRADHEGPCDGHWSSVEGSRAESRQRRSKGGDGKNAVPNVMADRSSTVVLPERITIRVDGYDGTIERAGSILGLGGGENDGCVRGCGCEAFVTVPVERGMMSPVDDGAESVAVLLG